MKKLILNNILPFKKKSLRPIAAYILYDTIGNESFHNNYLCYSEEQECNIISMLSY